LKRSVKEMSEQKIRWARNAQLAKYAGVSSMTVWRWKKLPDFPKAAVINGIEYRDLDAFDNWMSGFIPRRDAEPTRGQRAVKNLRREAGAA
jgi:transcriptional regulator with XRE-family HTH domain